MFWIGCAAHEVSLLFKEWIKKIPELLQLFNEGLRIVKFVNNHSEILKLYRALVPDHFEDKRKHCIMLYTPGDTRMMTVFRMLYRISVLKPVLVDLVGTAAYGEAAQKALQAWSSAQPPEKTLVQIDGKFPDKVKHSLQSSSFWDRVDQFIMSTKSAIFLKSLVDGQTPVLGKFYYSCALVDKHLRVLKEKEAVPYIDAMRTIYMKRWKRWHRPIHTFSYAVDPCYQSHKLTAEEKRDCRSAIMKLGGGNWASLKVKFDRWRSSGESIFPPEVWDAADKHHGYQWWDSFGDDFTYLQDAASSVLSKPIAASACEFNWSEVGSVVSKKTQRFTDAKIDKQVNVRAMNRLEKSISGKILLGNVPKIDDYLDQMVNEAIASSPGGGDDVEDPEAMEDDDESDDDAYDLDMDSEEIAEFGEGRINDDLLRDT